MAPYTQFTLTDILLMLSYKFDDVPFWTEVEAIDAINEGLLTWNAFTGFWKETIEIITTINNWDYALPESLVFGMRIEFNDKPLNQSSLSEMDNGHPGWQGQTTTDGGSVPDEPKNWFPLSVDMIGIWPADADGGNTLTVDGVAATPQLVDPGDFINIGEEELGIILGYALHVLALKEGGERFAKTADYFTEFLKAAAEENDQLTQSSIFREFIGLDQSRDTPMKRGKPTSYDQFSGRQP